MSQDYKNLHTEGVLSDYFTLEGHLLSTRSADAYKAVDTSRNQPGCLWMLKCRLEVGSEEVYRFLSRMDGIHRVEPKVTSMTAYGVDAEGVAFAVFPPWEGQVINSGNIDKGEGERRLTSCLNIIKGLHSQKIACGDLCPSSFLVDRSGQISFVGVMGSFGAEAALAAGVPASTLPFFAPEQRAGSAGDARADVFALGVLGYFLLTGNYPYGEGEAARSSQFNPNDLTAPSAFLHIPPVWADTVLLTALNPDLNDRYQTAGEMAEAMGTIRKRAISQEQSPVSVQTGFSLADQHKEKEDLAPVVQDQADVPSLRSRGIPSRSKVFVLSFLVVLVLLLVLADKFATMKRDDDVVPLPSDLTNTGRVPDIGKGIGRLAKLDSQTDRAKEIQALSESNDPIAHYTLVKSAKAADTEAIRRMVEKGILNRARRLGLVRSAELVRQWLRKARGMHLPEAYEAILRITDTSLPHKDRFNLLKEAYRTEPDFILRYTAALAFDTDLLEHYQPILSGLVADLQGQDDLSEYSFLAIVLSHLPLARVFGDEIVQHRDKLTDEDILWILPLLAERNDVNTRAIANLALERDILPPQRRIFMKAVRDKPDLPADVMTALIKAASGALVVSDLAAFGRWIDASAAEMLLAVMADTTEPKLLKEAFDLVAGKSFNIEPSASFLRWVQRNYSHQRVEFAHLVGVLAYVNKMREEDIRKAFENIDKFATDPALVDKLIMTKNPILIKLILKKHPSSISLDTKMLLLTHPDKEIRIKTIYTIDSNELVVLKMVVNSYEEEKDPEVRKHYERRFWVIGNRS